ncbi:hypothetical protein [Sulfurovum riftiae]|uniref:Uncharacterized protein n=1 Tax=Sulfurovum riftiae TaxID=1630136 RepID=A0A151CI38_9BACT|nr:hypothetical protein [Sulfurovum riftiae]KYJ87198.1 hypothetical protein AS592_11910 [Sulfurovum riftiae]
MEKMTLKAYAIKHKMSMFNVVKLVKSGKVKSETVEEEGKNVVYVFEEADLELPAENDEAVNGEEKPAGLLKRVAALENEVALLRKEIKDLKKLL